MVQYSSNSGQAMYRRLVPLSCMLHAMPMAVGPQVGGFAGKQALQRAVETAARLSLGCKRGMNKDICFYLINSAVSRGRKRAKELRETTLRPVLTGALHGREKLVSALPAREAAARVARGQRWGRVLATQAGEQAAREDVLKVRAR